MSRKTYPHKLPVLKNCGGDLSKKWYLEFYQWDIQKEKLIRKRWYKGFPNYKTVEDRTAYGNGKAEELARLLPYHCIGLDRVEHEIKQEALPKQKNTNLTVGVAVQKYLDEFYSDTVSYNDYNSRIRLFIEYIEDKVTPYWFETFTRAQAQAYVDFLSKSGLQSTTISNRIAPLKSVYSKAIKRGYVEHNPFEKLEMPKRLITNKNMAYSLKQIKVIKKASKENPFLWLIAQYIYYSYMRPIELRRLKVRNILLPENKIYIPAEISLKNKKESYIMLARPLKQLLLDYGIKNYPDHYYLFTSKKKPGLTPISKTWMNQNYSDLIRPLNLGKEFTLYSWKHTGVVNAYKNGVDIKALQIQCRHHSVSQTDTYLKSLGFMDNDEFMKGIPEI